MRALIITYYHQKNNGEVQTLGWTIMGGHGFKRKAKMKINEITWRCVEVFHISATGFLVFI
jgi:hypothetical protein